MEIVCWLLAKPIQQEYDAFTVGELAVASHLSPTCGSGRRWLLASVAAVELAMHPASFQPVEAADAGYWLGRSCRSTTLSTVDVIAIHPASVQSVKAVTARLLLFAG